MSDAGKCGRLSPTDRGPSSWTGEHRDFRLHFTRTIRVCSQTICSKSREAKPRSPFDCQRRPRRHQTVDLSLGQPQAVSTCATSCTPQPWAAPASLVPEPQLGLLPVQQRVRPDPGVIVPVWAWPPAYAQQRQQQHLTLASSAQFGLGPPASAQQRQQVSPALERPLVLNGHWSSLA